MTNRLNFTTKHLTWLVIIVVVGFLASVYVVDAKGSKDYPTCAELYAATHRKNIPKDDPLYNIKQDRDKDNFSCDD